MRGCEPVECTGPFQSRIETILRSGLRERVAQIEEAEARATTKELQTALPAIVASVFGCDGRACWGLRSDLDAADESALHAFLAPSGALFRICYRLIADPHLKFSFPARLLPKELVRALDAGRVPRFYADELVVDAHSRRLVALELNPFDLYVFHFAVYLRRTEATEARSTLYYRLACEYLAHFLPADLNASVLPHLPYFTGKTPSASPRRPASRLCPRLSPVGGQFHPRGEVWRSETVLQAFVDVWLNVDEDAHPHAPAESVRVARALVKQCHAFASHAPADPTSLGELRRAASSALAPKTHDYLCRLMRTWPLDSSFRLVLELWFSFVQPWRYRSPQRCGADFEDSIRDNTNRDAIEARFYPFISENLLAYTEIFQLVVPRFLRLNLTVPKNAIMLFRLTKVFSQSNLVQLLVDMENSVANEFDSLIDASSSRIVNVSSLTSNSNVEKLDRSGNSVDNSHQQNSVNTSVLGVIDASDVVINNNYRPLLFGEGRSMAKDLLVYASQAYLESEQILKLQEEQLKLQNKGKI